MVQIFTSSILGEVTVDSTAKTATLGGSKQWIDDVVDYYIAFENDDYENEYLITANTTTTITFEDLNNSAPSGNYDFVVRGKPKGEVLELNGYVLHWEYLSKSFKPFSSSDLGSNP
jgi:hypothetical protein